MKALVLALGLAAGSGAALAATPSVVQSLAGRYDKSFPDGFVSGEKYTGQNIVEIVPVDARHAYVRMHLDFYNGHICGIRGVAEAQHDALIYQEPAERALAGQPRCKLTIRRQGRQLSWSDGQGSCKGYCGMRGTLSVGSVPWASKRAITYLPRLRRSREYRDALTEWHSGHEVIQ